MRDNDVRIALRIRPDQQDKVAWGHSQQPVSQPAAFWEFVQQYLFSRSCFYSCPGLRYVLIHQSY